LQNLCKKPQSAGNVTIMCSDVLVLEHSGESADPCKVVSADYRAVFRIPPDELAARSVTEVIAYFLTESRSPGWNSQMRAPIKIGDIIWIPKESILGGAWMICPVSPHRTGLMFTQWPDYTAKPVEINFEEIAI